jgi:hypothetical protein
MGSVRGGISRWRLLALALVCLGGCSSGALEDNSVPMSCSDLPLPHRCDVCSNGETVCAHYVIRGGVCMAETCPTPTPVTDAGVPGVDGAAPGGVDASTDTPGITQVGPTYACGPADAGLTCSCGTQTYFPAPIIDGGQQMFVLPPDPATVVAYGTMAAFDALAVGRWQRTAGMGELICEQYGVEFTADHQLIPLVIASDGSVQRVNAQAMSFSITFDGAGAPRWLQVTGLSTNPPTFFDGGHSMYFLFSPWPADYVRAP